MTNLKKATGLKITSLVLSIVSMLGQAYFTLAGIGILFVTIFADPSFDGWDFFFMSTGLIILLVYTIVLLVLSIIDLVQIKRRAKTYELTDRQRKGNMVRFWIQIIFDAVCFIGVSITLLVVLIKTISLGDAKNLIVILFVMFSGTLSIVNAILSVLFNVEVNKM